MFRASRDFVILSLDGSRAVENQLQEGQPATAQSILDHYISRPTSTQFRDMTFLHFTQMYTMPQDVDSDPSHRRKDVVIASALLTQLRTVLPAEADAVRAFPSTRGTTWRL